jgi:DNA-binding NtrC family response regulator
MKKKVMDVFVIEDDARYSKILANTIEAKGHNVIQYEKLEDCLRSNRKNPDLAFVSQNSTNTESNTALIQEIKFNSPSTRLVVMSQKESLELAVRALKNGASDFIVKDARILARVGITIQKAEQAIAEKQKRWAERIMKKALPTIGLSALGSILLLILR